MQLLNLPNVVIEEIFRYLDFDEVAKLRIVCRRFNKINQEILNHGFYKLTNNHAKQIRRIKSQLPRRESERRNHPLSKYSDILTCVETRLSMLSMTYLKYMQNGSACFIPGKVIDEVYKIMKMLQNVETPKSLKSHEVLQELRDISSMAIEHFDEKIVPHIKKNLSNSPRCESYSSSGLLFDLFASSSSSSQPLSRDSSASCIITEVKTKPQPKPHKSSKSKLSGVVKMYKKQSYQIKLQAKQIAKMGSSIKVLKRRLDESEVKNRELSENVKVTKGVITSTASSSPSVSSSFNMSIPCNIKPRSATIMLKRNYVQD
ncbi:unnamed protein product [Diamesa hyperborea]